MPAESERPPPSAVNVTPAVDKPDVERALRPTVDEPSTLQASDWFPTTGLALSCHHDFSSRRVVRFAHGVELILRTHLVHHMNYTSRRRNGLLQNPPSAHSPYDRVVLSHCLQASSTKRLH